MCLWQDRSDRSDNVSFSWFEGGCRRWGKGGLPQSTSSETHCATHIHWGINLIRNPLSARNPGVSRCWFETPPPSTVKCCLAMFLETYIGDCLSTCQAPAICPAVNKCIASLSPLPSPPLLGPQRSKPIIPLCTQWLSDLNYDTHHSGSLHWRPHVATWRTQAIACAHLSHGCSTRPCLSLVWSVCSNRVAGHCVCTSESWVLPECSRPCLSLV